MAVIRSAVEGCDPLPLRCDPGQFIDRLGCHGVGQGRPGFVKGALGVKARRHDLALIPHRASVTPNVTPVPDELPPQTE
jgi:hypothetical protein